MMIDRWGSSPLFFVDNLTNAEELIIEGYDIFDLDNFGNTVLHTNENPDVVRYFISLGISPNTQNNNGDTALHTCKNIEVLFILLREGEGDVRILNHNGNTARYVNKDPEIEDIYNYIKAPY